ncbi:MAG: DUF4255 domain-containing protein [Thermoanaerobaculia bacterium]
MPFSDLSNVTRTLSGLLEANISRISGLTVTVTAQSPEQVSADTSNQISLFLYHAAEDGYYKNTPGPGSDRPNVARAPMALNLYYILTAHHRSGDDDTDQDSLIQQDLMGHALKTFHDFPVITDDTEIDGTPILANELQGRDNSLQIVLRPVSPEDAVAFWSSEEAQVARLAAYYEVRVVLLEPEEPETMPGIVLNVGSYLYQLGAPHLECSLSTVVFDLPAVAGGDEQRIEATPARVAPVPPHDRLAFLGTHLTRQAQTLFLRNARWRQLGTPIERVDAAPWNPEFATDRVDVDVGTSILHEGVPLDVLPGIYTALVQVVLDQQMVYGELKQITAVSNEVAFTVGPRIQSHDPPNLVQNRVTVNVVPDLAVPALDEAIEVIVAGQVYQRRENDTFAPALAENDGFCVVGASTVTLQALFDLSVPGLHPLRLLVDGAESQPFWIEIS